MREKEQRRPGGGGAAVSFGRRNGAEDSPKPHPVKPTLVEALDALLAGRWPDRLRELFNPRNPRPLAIGIHEQVAEAAGLAEHDRYRLHRLLGRWTGRQRYLEAIAAPGARRHGIDGEPVGAVSPEHQAAAQEQLERAQLKRARRAAQQQRELAKEQQARQRDKPNACRANAGLPLLRLGALR